MIYLWIALGSAAGGVLRALCGAAAQGMLWATPAINVAGSLLIGRLAAQHPSEAGRAFWMTGVCGGFTTFSAFSLQTLQLLQAQRIGTAAAYVSASVGLSLCAVWAGYSSSFLI